MIAFDGVKGFFELSELQDDPSLPITPCRAVELTSSAIMEYCSSAIQLEVAKVHPKVSKAFKKKLLRQLIEASKVADSKPCLLQFIRNYIHSVCIPSIVQELKRKRALKKQKTASR